MNDPPALRRSRKGLLWGWAIGLVAIALVYWATWKIPALTELLRPFYWIIVAALVFVTVRWFRPRSGDRRRGDRRRRRTRFGNGGDRGSSNYHAE